MLLVKWPKVLYESAYIQKPLIEWIDLGNGTMFRITAFFVLGAWNEPRRGFFVGIERCGCFLFAIGNQYSAEYVAHKLNIPESDGAALADWMNTQIDQNFPQQGNYEEQYFIDAQPYGLIGENKTMPLMPEIIIDA